MKPCLIVYIFLSLLVMPACSQSFDWWKNLVSWDGISSWKEYIRYNPRYLGPNALPVPFIGNGSIDSISSFSITGNFHTTKGDQTINPTLYANYNIVKDRISIDAFLVPIERYNVSHKLKEERNVYYLNYYDKAATGDLHLNMNIQLLNKIRNKIHLSLRLGFRYASSEKIAAARFTDAPGYFFDLSAGKKLGVSSNWKLIAMAGFLVWQTNTTVYAQNDDFLFGSGLEYNKKGLTFQTSLSGYLGYRNDGDHPVVYRFSLQKRKEKLGWLFRSQIGLNDFLYKSVEGGVTYNFTKRLSKRQK